MSKEKAVSSRQYPCTLSLLLSFLLAASGALAQQPESDEAEAEEREKEELEEIVVLGSRIKGARITGIMPVSIIGEDSFEALEADTVGELLGSLPAAVDQPDFGDDNNSARGSQNAARGDITALNMRQLGNTNTLHLLNGRRLVRHSGWQNENGGVPATPVNTSSLPANGIRRIEILRNGAAAIYGADAVAGVVNTVMRTRFEGLTVQFNYGESAETPRRNARGSIYWGKTFNEGRTNISGSLRYTDRNGYLGGHGTGYSDKADLRPFFEGTIFEGDTQLDNRATYSSWGQFRVVDQLDGFTDERINDADGNRITSNSGSFHIQPINFAETEETANDCRGGTETGFHDGVCIDSGGRSRASYYNDNKVRQVRNDVERTNVFLFINHEFESGLESFTELGYYSADSHRQDPQSNFVGSGPLTMSPDAYWNPFGETLSGNPNRLALSGADSRPEGYALRFQAYRQTDAGVETSEINNRSFRIVTGLRNRWRNWDWETGVVYSEATTTDTAFDRVSSTLFMEAMNRTDETAYNPFNGGCLNDIRGDDTCTPGASEDVFESFLIDVVRYDKSRLATWDFRVSNPEIFNTWAGPVGLATGLEWRRETFMEDRDDRIDGTIPYVNSVNPARGGDSDVLGLSSTPDFSGSQNTYSAYAELMFPLVRPDMHVPLMESFDIQVAGRYEDYSVVGDITRVQTGAGWRVSEDLLLRGSYSQGFKTPSLPVLHAPVITRNSSGTDNYRCYAASLLGTDEEVNALFDAGRLSQANRDFAIEQNDVTCADGQGAFTRLLVNAGGLTPETNDTRSIGFVLTPRFIDGLIFTLDHWEIRQENIVGLTSTNDNLKLDFVARLNSDSAETNPFVNRLAPTSEDIELYTLAGLVPAGRIESVFNPYLNLERRTTRGVDMELHYRLRDIGLFGLDIGSLRFTVSASKLISRFQLETEALKVIEDLGFPDLTIDDGFETAGRNRPKWRRRGTITWSRDSWQAGITAKYIDSFLDTSLSDADGNLLLVEGGWAANAYIRKRFNEGPFAGLTVKVGMRNVTDVKPSRRDSTFGYSSMIANLEGRYGYCTITQRF